MSRVVPLSRLQQLGIRGRDDPAVASFVWSGLKVDDGGLRGLHEALHPTLLLLALAGYRIDQLVLGAPDDNGEVVLVELSPRAVTRIAWTEYMETDAAEWPFDSAYGIVVWLKPHPGLTGGAVPLDAVGGLQSHVVTLAGWPFLGYDLGELPFLTAVMFWLGWQQDTVRDELASRIINAFFNTNWDETTTGLLAALQPDLWTFPRLADDQDLRRRAFRQLGEAIADPALAGPIALQAFLLEEAVVRSDDGPPSVHDRLVVVDQGTADALKQAWNTEASALWREINPDGRDPFRAADHRKLSYCELVFDVLNESLISLAGYDPVTGDSAYGGYDLQRGDHDPAEGEDEWTYAGGVVTGTATTYIEDLRSDLETVGFGPLADGDVHLAVPDPEQPDAEARRRSFGAHLEAAVREFQIYASLPFAGRLPREDELPDDQDHPSLGSTLIQETNDQRYSGPISGVLNTSTRALLKMWVERDWHCPVVVEARELERDAHLEVLRDPGSQADKTALVTGVAIDEAHQNLWRRNQLEDLRKDSEGPYAFIVWDHSGHYPQAPGRRGGEPVVIARWAKGDSWGGAYARAGWHTWPESECTPVNVLGQTPALAGRPQQGAFWSSYRVIRAVSECECQGVLDGMNAYDSAILSGGPIHFTLGLAKNPKGRGLSSGPGPCIIYPGELCPALSLLADEDPDEYERYFGVFGLQPREPWDDPPAAMFSSAHRKYRGWVQLEDDKGSFADTRENVPAPIPDDQDHEVSHEDLLLIEVLHHWHWIYRWQMAPRLSRAFREVTYRLSRARLRALRSTPWGTSGYTLGQVFTSELAVAILERLHVYSPPNLFGDLKDKEAESGGQTVADIKFTLIDDAYDEAVKTGGADPTTWGDAEEKAIVDKLVDLNLKDDIPKVVEWPNQTSYEGRLHDVSVLPIAKEEAPEIAAIAPRAVAPGAEARVRFTVTDRETEPGGCTVSVSSSHEDRLVASVEPAGGIEYDLVLTAPAGAGGEVTVKIIARDRRQKTTREVMVNVTADGELPDGAGAYDRPDPVGLSELRWSFELDDEGLFQQPPG